MTPAEFVLALSESRGESLYAMSTVAGVTRATLQNIKLRGQRITPRVAQKLVAVCDYSYDEIMAFNDNFVSPSPRSSKPRTPEEEARIAHIPRDIKTLSKYCDLLLEGNNPMSIVKKILGGE